MRHLQVGRKLGVNSSHRIARLRGLALSLIEHPRIKTTPARAKEVRWYAERIITLAKRGDLSARRKIVQLLGSTRTQDGAKNRVRRALEKVYGELVPRFNGRTGGYTQIIRLPFRRAGDNAELCFIQYIPSPEEKKAPSAVKKTKKQVAASSGAEAEGAPKSKAAQKPKKSPAKKTRKKES